MKLFPALVAAFSIIVPVGAALAGGFTGNWPLTVSHAKYGNGAYCLTISDDGSVGWPHSGYVSLQGPGGNLPFGTFQLISHLLTVTVEQQGGSGQNAGLVFAAPARNGSIGKGVHDQVYGGEAFDTGVVVFGAKGGC